MGRGGPQVTVVAELVGAGRGMAARSAFVAGPPVPVSRSARGDAQVGDLVTVVVRGGAARVVAVHGPARSPRAAITALMASEGLGRSFSAAVLAEAEEARDAHAAQDPGRHDLTRQRVITIDPEGAKDHDDAVAVAREGDAVRLWVHIADVARHVPAGGLVDREAARRGCSVYLPGTVEPMLPERLSSDLCSLRPGAPRKAVTVEIVVAPDGAVVETRFSRSLIRSERRLTYPEVDRLFAGGSLGDADLEADLEVARDVARRLRAVRIRRGALEVASAEPLFRFEGDRVVDMEMELQTEAHRLVEDCMVAANEAVARYLLDRRQPTVFRVHDDPAEQRIGLLYDQLEELGVPTPPLHDGPLTPLQCRAAAREAAAAVARHVERTGRGRRSLPTLVLRALRQAHYVTGQVGHSGLASPVYLHFTSPIRRYPDLMVHRALLDALGQGEPAPEPGWLDEVAAHSSETERAASALERRGDRMCAAYLLLARQRDPEWQGPVTGEVTGVIDAGAFVAIGEGFEGFLASRRLEDDHYRADPLGVALVGDTAGRRIRIGDEIPVVVGAIDPLRGRVDLEPPVTEPPGAGRRARRLKGARAR
jgi:ribonuclease R